jgi:outer membrane protein insertion porin family
VRRFAALAVFALLGCARTTPTAVPQSAQASEVTLTRAVEYDGARYKQLRVRFVGAEHAHPTDLARELSVVYGLVDRDHLDRDVVLLQAWYYDRGFVNMKVTEAVTVAGDEVTVTFVIREGATYRVAKLEVFEEVGHAAPLGWTPALHPGDVFRLRKMVDALHAVRKAYRDLGYAYVEADPSTDIDHARREISITVPIRRGPVTYFESIDIVGAEKLALAVIKSELTVSIGDKYNESALELSKKKLEQTAWFRTVAFATFPGSTPDKIKLSVEVEERPSTAWGQVATLP